MKVSTILYVLAAVLFGVAALPVGADTLVVDLGLTSTAAGLALGSVGN